MQMEMNILLNLSDLLYEEGFITEKERDTMKSIIIREV